MVHANYFHVNFYPTQTGIFSVVSFFLLLKLILLAGKGVSYVSLFNVPQKIPEESTYTVHLVVSPNSMHLHVSEPTLVCNMTCDQESVTLFAWNSTIHIYYTFATQCPLFHFFETKWTAVFLCLTYFLSLCFHNYYRSLSWKPRVQAQDLLHCPTHQFKNPNSRAPMPSVLARNRSNVTSKQRIGWMDHFSGHY